MSAPLVPHAFTEARAAAFAVHAHGEQQYGEVRYYYHLEAVRRVLVDFDINDPALCCAAWLHDVLEDTVTDRAYLDNYFGSHVAALVEAVTGRGPNRRARTADAYAKIEALPEAVYLKLADRIANAEASARDRPDLAAMYRKEQPGFEAMVFRAGMAGYETVRAMVQRLRAALELSETEEQR